MLAGEAACQDAARLRHIERIECPQHGDVQEMVAAFGNLRAYAVFFIAEDEQGGVCRRVVKASRLPSPNAAP